MEPNGWTDDRHTDAGLHFFAHPFLFEYQLACHDQAAALCFGLLKS
jgi:hypothetical protein